jgi:D-alanyl-lipoteichoic acid acyltransferase DltB (MBOAT superfamily)
LLFNSVEFLVFLPIVFVLYWFVCQRSTKLQNLLLVLASYVFYGWWDYRFLSLIVISSTVDYFVGLGLARASRAGARKTLLVLSLLTNLGLLGFFKYFGFFVDSMRSLLEGLGVGIGTATLHIVLPVGISFYTFQTLSYTIDVYRGKVEPCRQPISFFAYVGFFPQLVAGPIERATSLLPQFLVPRRFDPSAAKDGLRQILWGFFKKVAIADTLAPHVEEIFANHGSYGGAGLLLGVFFFAIQIYCDFSGYSDIAIGTARLFGFSLMRNFAFPYFSRDISEFWRRWHISLSSWFRDYLYIPLGGSRVAMAKRLRNVILTFTISGFWHGANWTFIFWGLLNGLYYVPLMLSGKERRHLDDPAAGRLLPTPRELGQIALTFALALLAWVFFRASSLGHAFAYLSGLIRQPLSTEGVGRHLAPLSGVFALLVIEWFQRDKQHALEIGGLPPLVRWSVYYATIFAILLFGEFGGTEFIYFQF